MGEWLLVMMMDVLKTECFFFGVFVGWIWWLLLVPVVVMYGVWVCVFLSSRRSQLFSGMPECFPTSQIVLTSQHNN